MIISGGGGGGALKLAPELDRLQFGGWGGFLTFDATAALTTILNATGKFLFTGAGFTSVTVNDITKIKVTIDGVLIHDSTVASHLNPFTIFGYSDGAPRPVGAEPIAINESLVIEVKATVDSSIGFLFSLRPIL